MFKCIKLYDNNSSEIAYVEVTAIESIGYQASKVTAEAQLFDVIVRMISGSEYCIAKGELQFNAEELCAEVFNECHRLIMGGEFEYDDEVDDESSDGEVIH